MVARRISRRLDHNVVSIIGKFLKDLRDNEKSLSMFYKSPELAFERAGIDFNEMGVTKEQKKAMIEDTATLVAGLLNGQVFIDPGSYAMDESQQSYLNQSIDHNFDHSSRSTTEYRNYTDTEAGAKSESKAGSSHGTTNTFEGFSLGIEKYSDGPLLSDKNIQIIQSNLINSINLALLENTGEQ